MRTRPSESAALEGGCQCRPVRFRLPWLQLSDGLPRHAAFPPMAAE
ncbi:hypothetical protein HNP55_001842 [Paucibacter oligotrophus]|uniref:Uncharacterized protein n=1 Tax=Roseateles oligotrophus TaxID=1769250 RepID=A0A840L995_9BURK|nr:hypothetical protein [Roseateles oligotrophus]MBB4843323.1 hypothetical protein [Roseateles oligotrophus]